jgi:hypothetical protein
MYIVRFEVSKQYVREMNTNSPVNKLTNQVSFRLLQARLAASPANPFQYFRHEHDRSNSRTCTEWIHYACRFVAIFCLLVHIFCSYRVHICRNRWTIADFLLHHGCICAQQTSVVICHFLWVRLINDVSLCTSLYNLCIKGHGYESMSTSVTDIQRGMSTHPGAILSLVQRPSGRRVLLAVEPFTTQH